MKEKTSELKEKIQLSFPEKISKAVLDKVLEKNSLTNGLGNENVKSPTIFLEIVPFM